MAVSYGVIGVYTTLEEDGVLKAEGGTRLAVKVLLSLWLDPTSRVGEGTDEELSGNDGSCWVGGEEEAVMGDEGCSGGLLGCSGGLLGYVGLEFESCEELGPVLILSPNFYKNEKKRKISERKSQLLSLAMSYFFLFLR